MLLCRVPNRSDELGSSQPRVMGVYTVEDLYGRARWNGWAGMR